MESGQQWKGWIQLILGLGLTFLFFYMMAPFVVAVLLGAVTAIVCYPLYLHWKGALHSQLAALSITVLVTLGILLPAIFVLYSGATRLLTLFSTLKFPAPGQPLSKFINSPGVSQVMRWTGKLIPVNDQWMRSQTIELLQSVVEKLSKLIASFLGGMPGLILAFFVVILSAYFFLVDGSKFLRFLSSLSPLPEERSADIYSAFEKSCRGVVLALLASAVTQGVIMAVFFVLTGLPGPGFILVLTIVMGMVPVVGSAPVWIGASIFLFVQGEPVKGFMMVLGGAIIATSDNIVRPWIMKGHSEMHPLLALVSVFGAVNLLGPTGIFLGPVIAAVFVSFLKILALEIRRENMSSGPPTSAQTGPPSQTAVSSTVPTV